jgi:hypothetical protein
VDAGRPIADWRSAAPYAVLAKSGRHAFAWEWLRRSPAYRDLDSEPAAFGLCRREPVTLATSAARPIWLRGADPSVLEAVAQRAVSGDSFDVTALSVNAACCVRDGIEHWLWSDGFRQIRLDVAGRSLRAGPALLRYRIAGCATARQPAETLIRFIALARTGRIVRSLFAPERRAPRWAMVLRAHDALAAGASHRDLAELLFDAGRVHRWRIEEPSYRQRVLRLVDAARRAAGVDPRRWLDGSFP